MQPKKISITVSTSIGSVGGEVMEAPDMTCLYVFAHGAGAGMDHVFMVKLSTALLDRGMGTLRFNFPYMEHGKKRPDPPAVAEKAVSRAIETAVELFPRMPLFAGGKSFGGRMTSQALSKEMATEVRGLIFAGFPLHPAGQPATDRASHLAAVTIPMLFLQGTRDALAQIALITQVCSKLPAATLRTFEGADHSFKAGKQDLIPALADAIVSWSSPFLR